MSTFSTPGVLLSSSTKRGCRPNPAERQMAHAKAAYTHAAHAAMANAPGAPDLVAEALDELNAARRELSAADTMGEPPCQS